MAWLSVRNRLIAKQDLEGYKSFAYDPKGKKKKLVAGGVGA